MQMSVFPTDSLEAREAILKQAKKLDVSLFFTSLHIPEAEGLATFVDWLKQLHIEYQYEFFADISPLTLERLNIKIDEVVTLKEYGIVGVRIDFGFSIAEIQQIAATGIDIAINASTVTKAELDILAPIGVIGWHNYYPRPETGISEAFFLKQNELLRSYNIPIYTFIPGTTYLRAPLFLQLPMLEAQRGVNAYINYLLQAKKYKVDKIFIAEGIIDDISLERILRYKNEDIITLPVEGLRADVEEALMKRDWFIRIEETDMSWRVEETRALVEELSVMTDFPVGERTIGSIYMDNIKYARYAGEIHLIHTVAAGNDHCNHVGELGHEYHVLLSVLDGRPKIKFERLEQ